MDTEEQRLDVIENCNLLLGGILRPFDQTDGTSPGRMITQLLWLKERAENHDLPLPVDPVKLSTMRYIYTNGDLSNLASNPDDLKSIRTEFEIYLDRLMALTKKGHLLIKKTYYPYAIRHIDALIRLLQNAPRLLSQYEQGSIPELIQLKHLLANGEIEPPLMSYLPDYKNLREVYSITGSSTEDLPNGKPLTETVAKFIV